MIYSIRRGDASISIRNSDGPARAGIAAMALRFAAKYWRLEAIVRTAVAAAAVLASAQVVAACPVTRVITVAAVDAAALRAVDHVAANLTVHRTITMATRAVMDTKRITVCVRRVVVIAAMPAPECDAFVGRDGSRLR